MRDAMGKRSKSFEKGECGNYIRTNEQIPKTPSFIVDRNLSERNFSSECQMHRNTHIWVCSLFARIYTNFLPRPSDVLAFLLCGSNSKLYEEKMQLLSTVNVKYAYLRRPFDRHFLVQKKKRTISDAQQKYAFEMRRAYLRIFVGPEVHFIKNGISSGTLW